MYPSGHSPSSLIGLNSSGGMIGIIGGGRNGTCGAGTSLPGVIPGGAGRYGTSGASSTCGFGYKGVVADGDYTLIYFHGAGA